MDRVYAYLNPETPNGSYLLDLLVYRVLISLSSILAQLLDTHQNVVLKESRADGETTVVVGRY